MADDLEEGEIEEPMVTITKTQFNEMRKAIDALQKQVNMLTAGMLDMQSSKKTNVLNDTEYPPLLASTTPLMPSLSLPLAPSVLSIASLPTFNHRYPSKIQTLADRLRASAQDRPKIVHALSILHRKKLPVAPNEATPNDIKHKLRRVYINGLPHLRLKELKQLLFETRFALSKIVNLSYVSKSMVEFTLLEDYHDGFVAHAKRCELDVAAKIDPSVPCDPKATAAIKEQITLAFRHRLSKLASSERALVSGYFRDWHDSLPVRVNAPLSASPPVAPAADNVPISSSAPVPMSTDLNMECEPSPAPPASQ